MITYRHRTARIFWCSFAALVLSAFMAEATIVNLIAYVSNSLNDSEGNPLADGSIVMIIGSVDNIANGMESFGGNLIANSTTGDDTIIGWVRIGNPAFDGDGTFLSDSEFSFVFEDYQYLYLRFFDTTTPPVGMEGDEIAWGVSDLFSISEEWGYVVTDFLGDYNTTFTNNFVVIPEPGTGGLVFLCLAAAGGLAMNTKRSGRGRKGGAV